MAIGKDDLRCIRWRRAAVPTRSAGHKRPNESVRVAFVRKLQEVTGSTDYDRRAARPHDECAMKRLQSRIVHLDSQGNFRQDTLALTAALLEVLQFVRKRPLS